MSDQRPTASWPPEPASGRGRSHGTSSREPFDRWFRYPAGFASDYVSLLLDNLSLTAGTVVDCFAGSGVTGTGARVRGLDFIGIEAHPLIGELATLKLAPTASPQQVRELCSQVLHAARSANPVGSAALRRETELIQRSFADEVLRQLITLRELIRSVLVEPGGPYLKWALLGSLRDVAGVKVGWPYQRPGVARKARYTDVLGRFETRANIIADDLASVANATTRTQLLVGDSQDPSVWAKVEGLASACIASPPYLNNFDYADATRLELYFWGEVRSWAEMCSEVRSDMVTATTQQSSKRGKADAISALEASGSSASTTILRLVEQIESAQAERGGRTKEYDRVAPVYFVSMSKILSNLHAALEPGASALWLVGDSAPYGVYVDTPGLIGELATEVGFEQIDDVRLRVRGNRWGSNADRHKVPLAERLLVMRKPT